MRMPMRVVAVPLGASAAATLLLAAIGPAQASLAKDGQALPAATVTGNTLFISGTEHDDAVDLRFASTVGLLSVDFGGVTPAETFDRTTFTSISVSLGGGADRLTVSPQGQFNNIPLTVDGGDGNDVLRGSDGNDVLIGGGGNDDVDGGRGADTELLGGGSDSALWVPGEASDVVDGGGGHDTLVFIGSAGAETFGFSADEGRAVLTRNLGNIRMDLSRVDEVDLDVATSTSPDGQLDTVAVSGTDRPDHVTVSSHDSAVDVRGLHTDLQITGNDASDQLHIATGAGNDEVHVTDAAAAAIGVSVDLGLDQH